MLITGVGILGYLYAPSVSAGGYYLWCALMGFGTGFWALFVTNASEQFGTNLRATATTSIANFVRGALVLITGAFTWLRSYLGIVDAAAVVGMACVVISLAAIWATRETFGRDLEFQE
jgi:riboflavin transporter FmnP